MEKRFRNKIIIIIIITHTHTHTHAHIGYIRARVTAK